MRVEEMKMVGCEQMMGMVGVREVFAVLAIYGTATQREREKA